MDFNTELQNILNQNNILAHKTMEHKEWEYYNVVVYKNGSIYITEPNHPMLDKIKANWNVVEGKIVLTKFELENVTELVKLEQGNIIVREL